MADTATTLASVLYEAWSSDTIQKQFYAGDGPLTKFERVQKTMIGKQAQVPILKTFAAGFTSFGAAGGSFNTAGNVGVDQAAYTLVTLGQPISLELSALNQAGGGNRQAVISSRNLAIESAIDQLRMQATRMLVTNGDGILGQCGTASSATVPLTASPSGTAWGYDAIKRGWLQVGQTVDVGTTSDTDTLVTATSISAIDDTSTAPTITIGTSISTTAGTHNVYMANPNSATAANPELNGLRNIVSASGALGGVNPATAGQEWWKAASRDTSTTVLSLDLCLSLHRSVLQNSGKQFSDVWSGYKQQMNYYSLLQNQVRFAGDMRLGAGESATTTWSGMRWEGFQEILDSDVWFLTLSDFLMVHGSITKPTWMSAISGAGGNMLWATGTTHFDDAVVYPCQLGVQRRNTSAGATALTA